MSQRLAGLDRIAAVQRQLKRIADWRLGEAEREAADAVEAQSALDAWIASEAPRGALAGAAVRQARRTALRRERAATGVERAAEAVREAGAKEKLVERRRDAVALEQRTMEERRALERMIEGFVVRGPAIEEG